VNSYPRINGRGITRIHGGAGIRHPRYRWRQRLAVFFSSRGIFSRHLGILPALLYSAPVLRRALLASSALGRRLALAALFFGRRLGPWSLPTPWSLPDPFIAAWLAPRPAVAASALGRRLSRSSPRRPSSPSLIFGVQGKYPDSQHSDSDSRIR
jgi:hypothetical protein